MSPARVPVAPPAKLPPRMKPVALLRAMRPHQWVKNVFVLAALVFSAGSAGGRVEAAAVVASLLALAAFCLGSSTIYLVNDLMDVEQDRAHPTKRRRPIASGELSMGVARVAAVVCGIAALALGRLVGPGVMAVVAGYVALNFAYSVKLKHVVLVDAFCIAGGFLLRVEAGGLAVGAKVSNWMLLCTFFLALFLALCKRKAEMDLLGEGRGAHRAILREYSAAFLDQMVTVMATGAILCYALYSISEDTVARYGSNLVWTVPFVVFGVGRYLLLVQTQKGGGSPTRVLLGGDAAFVLTVLGWGTVTALVVFGVL